MNKIISAFPGTGKSYMYNKNMFSSKHIILDSDSSKFDKSNFPDNYIEHIKEWKDKASIIFVSSHDTVRKALVENNIKFDLVYPDRSLKYDYINRYVKRGNDKKFIELLIENWDTWITEMESQSGCTHVVLQKGQYISDIYEPIN